MRELALFAGAGGGILGGVILGWRTVCAVEIDPYCQRVLLSRQRDGNLAPFPVWDDVRTFDGRPWRGHVDVASIGFPCQPFSSASRGRRVANDLWPDALRIVRECRPSVIAENVQRAPIERAAKDLTAIGYVARCARVSAACVAASHRRVRYWLVAHPDEHRERGLQIDAQMAKSSAAINGDWWSENHPELLGMDDGVAYRMDRLAALGNGQVPAVAALAFRTLRGARP